jgi:activator of HSP90 ATPase
MTGHPKSAPYKPKPVERLAETVAVSKPSTTPVSKQIGQLATIKQTVSFQCTAADLYDALTNNKKIGLWTRAPCTFEKTLNSPVSLFGGNISGKLLELVRLFLMLMNRLKMKRLS